MRRARDVMSPRLITVPETMDLATLARLFSTHKISGAPVSDAEGLLVGMVTQSDLTRARGEELDLAHLPAGPPEHDPLLDLEYSPHGDGGPEDFLVRDVMNRDLLWVEASTPLPQVSRTMLEYGVRRVLVLEDGFFAGIVTASDLVRAWSTFDRAPLGHRLQLVEDPTDEPVAQAA